MSFANNRSKKKQRYWWKFDFIDLKKTLSICLKNILKWNNKGNKSIMIFLIEQVGLK